MIRQGWEERNGSLRDKSKKVAKECGRLATSLMVSPVNMLAVMADLIGILLLTRVTIAVGL